MADMGPPLLRRSERSHGQRQRDAPKGASKAPERFKHMLGHKLSYP